VILSSITRTLSPHITKSIIYIDIVKNIWKDLKIRFLKGDYFRISYLFQEIHVLKQGERNMTQFYTGLKIL